MKKNNMVKKFTVAALMGTSLIALSACNLNPNGEVGVGGGNTVYDNPVTNVGGDTSYTPPANTNTGGGGSTW